MGSPSFPNRRRFLGATALAGMGAAAAMIAGSRGVQALTLAPMPAEARALYDAACGGGADPYHAQLVAAAIAAGDGRRQTVAEIEAELSAMRCPLCGCTLAHYNGPLPDATRQPVPKG